MEASRRSCSGLAVKIIEHVWTHRRTELHEVDALGLLDVDLLLHSLEDSGNLRAASALVHSIVRRRDVAHFETVLAFLEATHRLFPDLVTAIKHMKILFGLKTIVIMGMLREERGLIETVSKLIQFFPNKLPQYQHQCSPREMFLMRKNHRDFKDFAQVLALDKNRRQDYVETKLQEQYGERYAQRVEDRLLQYLDQLEAALPADTFVDRIMKKDGPVSEEEKLLLDVTTSDCTEITATLKKLLHCGAGSCYLDLDPKICQPLKSELKTSLTDAESGTFQRDRDRPPLSKESAVGHPQAASGSPEQEGSAKCPPQFCSMHRRWVTSILQECQEDGPEAPASCSPLLFPSASSASSSSQDLTPSDLVPSHSAPPPPTEQPSPETEKNDRRSDPLLLSAVVRLVDICTHPSSKAFQTSPAQVTVCEDKQATAPPANPNGRSQDGRSVAALCQGNLQEDAELQRRCTISKLSLKSRQTQTVEDKSGSPSPPARDSSASVTHKARSSRVPHQNATKPCKTPFSPPNHPPHPSTSMSDTSAFRSETHHVLRARTGSLGRLQAAVLQPYVRVCRLSVEQCLRAMAPCTQPQPQPQPQEEEEMDSSFDPNDLYSGSDGDDSSLHDPDYEPWG